MQSQSTVALRAPEPSDLEFMLRLENDPAIWTFGDVHAPLSREALMQYLITYDADPLRAGQVRFVILSGAEAMGAVDLFNIDPYQRTAFVGIALLPGSRGRGYGSEALRKLVGYGRHHLGLEAIAATVSTENPAGMRLFESCGFRRTGTLPAWRVSPGCPERRCDVALLTLPFHHAQE